MTSATPNSLECFAVTAPGLEPFAARELRALGVAPTSIAIEPGGVGFPADARMLYAANLWLRTASRVLVRVASFKATAFWELERRARPLAWERWIAPGSAVAVRATCRKSRLYHSDAVAERLVAAAAHRVRGVSAATDAGDDEDRDADGVAAAQLVVARLAHDVLTLSVDASGELLHRRGYRQAVAKAPVRETIAAAMLMASNYDPAAPLLDPFCGAGTLPIEAALIARDVAPGLARARMGRFACTAWPDFDSRAWAAVVAEAEERVRPAATAAIIGRDRDAGAVSAAEANAVRAGVGGDVTFERRAFGARGDEPAGRGLLVSNPPYGHRVSSGDSIEALWAQFGAMARDRHAGWWVALLSPDPALERRTKLSLSERFATRNGGLPVRLVAGVVGGE